MRLLSFIITCLVILGVVAAQGGSMCGPEEGSCSEGNCCSSSGFCGNTPLHCGPGCQSSFGTCTGGASASPSPSATTGSPITSPTPTIVSPSPSPSTSPESTTTTSTSTRSRRPTQTTKGTFQLQPTGKPSAAISAQDKSVRSTVALVVVFIAGFMIA